MAESACSSSLSPSARAIQPPSFTISASFMPRAVAAGVPRRMPLGRSGGFGSSGMICLLVVMEIRSSVSSADPPVDPVARHRVEHHHVVVGTAGHQGGAALHQGRGQGLGVAQHLGSVLVKLRLERLAQGDRDPRDGVHVRPALQSGEDRPVDLAANFFLHSTIPPRGPRKLLWVVVVTMSKP